MLAAGCIPPPSAPALVHKRASTPLSLLSSHQFSKPKLSLLPQSLLSNYPSLSISGRTEFCLFAKKKEKNPTVEVEEIEGFQEEEDDEFDFDDDVDFDDEDEDFDDEEEGDDEDMLPYHKMNALLEKKPKGFGEGKVYDTRVEEELLQEIEQSMKAKAENLKKLKKEPRNPKPDNNELKEVFKGVPGGIRVRINNLPKKRNIHRDLKSAFEGVPGIINILPVNDGNKKTRDPKCKGLAFVDFKSLADANSFVQKFSGKAVVFGKTEKPVKCEILKPLDGSDEGSSYNRYNSTSEGSLNVLEEEEDEEDEDDEFELDDSQLQLGEVDDFGIDDFEELIKGFDGKYALGDENENEADSMDRIEKLEAKLLARAALYEAELKAKTNSEEKSNPDKKPNQKPNKKTSQKPEKKPSQKQEKKPKLTIPGSAKKLKVREKAKLADVYSRYGKRGA